jgi:DNA processing protein
MAFDIVDITGRAHSDALKDLLGDSPLYAIGNVRLLGKKAMGVCGSRDASASALRWAYDFGREAAKQGVVVVSGYARGVDREAHRGALEAGGQAIAVLPEGIRHFRLVRGLRPVVDLDRNLLALSTFEPDAPWEIWRAMERNKVIVGLSADLFVIEARERGGTINAAYEAVRQGKPLYAVSYTKDLPGREGNRKLLATSAIPVRHMRDLKHALEEAMSQPPPAVKQLVMSLVGPENP